MAIKRSKHGGYLPPSAPQHAATVRTRVSGDRTAAEAMVPGVLKFLVPDFVKAGQFQNLQQSHKIVEYPNGGVVHLRSAFGAIMVDVYSPPAVSEAEVGEEVGERAEEPLEPAGVFSIELRGSLVTHGTGTSSTLDGFIVWNTGEDAALEVPKTGEGGLWEYPVSATDYSADFFDDLTLLLGGNTAETPATSLVSSTAIVSDIVGSRTSTMPESSFISALYVFQRQDRWFPSYVFCDAANTSTPDSITETGSVANNAGQFDTWDDDGTFVDTWDRTCVDVGGTLYRANIVTAKGKEHTLSFATTSGDTPTRLFMGYPSPQPAVSVSRDLLLGDISGHWDTVTALPVPAKSNALFFTVDNSSGAPNEVIAPSITYSGTISSSMTLDEGVDYVTMDHTNDGTSSCTVTGTGEFTSAGGGIYPVAFGFTEASALAKAGGTTVIETFTALDTFSSGRTCTFANSHIAHDSVQNLDNNLQAIIIIDTLFFGSGTAALTQMQDPVTYASLGSEEEPVFTTAGATYEVQTIAAIVADADTQNPWALTDSANLEAGVLGSINALVVGSPVATNQYWQIRPIIKNIEW